MRRSRASDFAALHPGYRLQATGYKRVPTKKSYRTVDLVGMSDYSPPVSLGSGASSGGTPKAERDAAPAHWLCRPIPGRPRAAVRPHYGGLPSVAGRGGMRGGESPSDPGGSSEGSPSFPQRKNGPGDRNRRRWSAGRRLSPIARGKGTLPSVPGGLRIAQEVSQASAFPGALLPIWSGRLGVDGEMTGRVRA